MEWDDIACEDQGDGNAPMRCNFSSQKGSPRHADVCSRRGELRFVQGFINIHSFRTGEAMSGRDGGSIGRCRVLISAKSQSRKSPPPPAVATIGRKLGRLVYFRGATPFYTYSFCNINTTHLCPVAFPSCNKIRFPML